MNPSTFRTLVCATALVICLLPAVAQAKPVLSFSLPAYADAGRTVAVRYQAKRLGIARLALQRRVGTGGAWRTVKSLAGRSGSVQAPSLSMGSYRLRLVAVARRRIVAFTSARRLLVFADVPFSVLFGADEHTFTFPAFTFAWAFNSNANKPRAFAQVQPGSNVCRAVHVDWAYDTPDQVTGTLSIVQESRDPVLSTGPEETRLAADAIVSPTASWGVTVASSNGTDYVRAFVNGRASCWQATRIG